MGKLIIQWHYVGLGNLPIQPLSGRTKQISKRQSFSATQPNLRTPDMALADGRDFLGTVGEFTEIPFCRPYRTEPSVHALCPSSKLLGYCQLSLAGQSMREPEFANRPVAEY